MNEFIIKHGFKSKAASEIEGSLKLLNLTNSEIDAASADIAVTKDWVSSNFTNKEGTVTSIGMSVPTGLTVNPSSITTSGIFAIDFESGYSIPTNTKQGNWDSAYNHSLVTSGNPHHVAWDELIGSQPAPIAHTHPWSDITGTPTTLAGYGITDAYTKTESDNKYALVGHNHTLDSLSNVAITTKVIDDILKWDGNNWVNVQGNGLSAVDASNISNVMFTLDDGTKIIESFGHHHSEYALNSWVNDNFSPISGSNSYIWNQNVSAQPANMRISGEVHAGMLIIDDNIVVNGSGEFGSTVTATNFIGNWNGYATSDFAIAKQTISSDNTGDYTPVSNDEGKLLKFTGTSNHTVTLNNILWDSSGTKGGRIDFIQRGSGTITFAAGSGMTLLYESTATTRGLNAIVSAEQISSTEWVIVGGLA